MTLFPAELVSSRAYGSFFQSTAPVSRFVITNLYWCPIRASGTSVDQYPLSSLVSGVAVADHSLNSPATLTARAKGAQTRKVTPSGYGMAPMYGRVEAVILGPLLNQRRDVAWAGRADTCRARRRDVRAPYIHRLAA